ncbi:MAG: hypothetical protein AAF206_23725, partial [Bacteroidota bacterium]
MQKRKNPFRLFTVLATMLILVPCSLFAQFQKSYELMGPGLPSQATGKSTVSVQQPHTGEILYINRNEVSGFSLHKLDSKGDWLDTYHYQDLESNSISLSHDDLHVIVVGGGFPQIGPIHGPEFFAMKIRISDGAVIWSRTYENNAGGGWTFGNYMDEVVITRSTVPSHSYLIFGSAFVPFSADKNPRKLLGWAINDNNGNLIWSQIYTEVNPTLAENLNNQPTDVVVDELLNRVYVVTEMDNKSETRVG